jgi:hypothetical protein
VKRTVALRVKENLGTQINEKFDYVSSADENKLKKYHCIALFENYKRTINVVHA